MCNSSNKCVCVFTCPNNNKCAANAAGCCDSGELCGSTCCASPKMCVSGSCQDPPPPPDGGP